MADRFAVAASLTLWLVGPGTAWAEPPWGKKGGGPPKDPRLEEEGGPPEIMEEADEGWALGFLRENDPEMHREVQEQREAHPEEFRRQFRRHLEGFRQIRHARDPEIKERFIRNIKSGFRLHRLAEKARKAESEKEKAELKPKLKEALEEMFEAQLAAQELQVARMQKELARVKGRIDKRRKEKAAIVEKKLEELTGESESFEW